MCGQRRSEIKSTLIHELTHAAYTIKDRYGIGEKHIFSKTGKDYLSGEYRQIIGDSTFVEAIVNYISSKIERKNPNELKTYQAETKAMYMLSEKMNEKSIIQAAWNSDEQQFKQAYIESIGKDITEGEKSYHQFREGMKRLIVIREQTISIGENNRKNETVLSELQQILDGKSHSLETAKFKDIRDTIKPEDHVSSNAPKAKNNLSFAQKIAKFLKKHKILINIPFIRNFTKKQLDILPPARKQEENNISSFNSQRTNLINELSHNGEYRKLPPIKINEERQNSENIKGQIVEESEK